MTDDSRTLADLDTAIRAHAEDLVDDGEVITNWIVLAATRRFDGGGDVHCMVSDEDLPTYVARGMFGEVVAKLDRSQARLEQGDDDG